MSCSKENLKAEGLNFWSAGDLNHNEPVVDIIAVQGLGANPYYTWVKKIKPVKSGLFQTLRALFQKLRALFPYLGDTSQIANNTAEVMWLRDFLPGLFPNARIASYSYKSDWRNDVKTSLRECAEQFLNHLCQNRSCDQERQRPLIIIGHSLGGLVVKQALVIAVHGEVFRDIRLAMCGVIFLGTPHQGVPAAEYGEWLARATDHDTTLVNTLKRNSPILDGLARDFEQSYGEADIVCFYENKDNRFKFRTVDYISASLPSRRRVYLATDHSGLNKYHGAEDGNFLLVQSELKRMVKEAPKTVERQYSLHGPTVGNEFFRVDFDLKGIPAIGEFVGRKDELNKIAQIMLPHSTEKMRQKICLLYGIGGVGKTQLAVEFARKYKEEFSAVFWIAGSTKARLRQSINSLVEQLPQYQISERARSILRSNDQDFDAIVPDVLKWFKKPSNDKWLLIFDNVDREFPAQSKDPESFDICKYIPSGDQGSILITSQLNEFMGSKPWKPKTFKLEPFDDRQGEELLKSIVGSDLKGSSELVNLLQGLPLAINQAGSFMRETSNNPLSYMQLYKELWEELMEEQHGGKNAVGEATDRSILTTWTLSFKNLEEKSEEAARFLILWAFLDNQDIWYELFKPALDQKITNQLPGWFSRCVQDRLEFSKRTKLLMRYSFVSANLESSSFSMHAIFQRWCLHIISLRKDDANIAWLAIMVTASAVPPETGVDYSRERRLLPHCNRTYLSLQRIPENFDEGLSSALNTACHSLAKVLIDQGKILEAEAMYQRAKRGKKKALGPNDKSTLDTLNNLGNLYLHQGKLQKAKEMYEEVLEGKITSLGPDHISTLNTVNNLGVLYKTQGKLVEAEDMYKRALDGYGKASEPGYIAAADTLHNLGMLHAIQGKFQEAKGKYEEAHARKEKCLGPNHTSTLETVNDLGKLYFQQGEIPEAKKMKLKALAGFEKALGPEHTSTLVAVNNLGILYADEGMMEEAEKEYQRALAGYLKALGPEHISTLEIVNNLGNLYFKQEKLPEAEELYVQALDGYTKALGPEHISTLEIVNNLGNLYFKQGKLSEAEKFYKQALDGNEKALGPGHTTTLATVTNLGVLYRTQGKIPNAEDMCKRALDGYETAWGPEHASTLTAMYYLGILYHMQGKISQAEEKYLRALTGFEKTLGAEHSSTLATARLLGNLFRTQDKVPEAKARRYLQALNGYAKNTLQLELISTIQIVCDLGFVYHKLEDFPNAETMFKRALAGFEKAMGPEHTTTLDTVLYLGIAYYSQGKLPEAEAMYERALAGYEKTEKPENRRRTLDIRYMLAGLLEKMSKNEIATVHFKQVVEGYTELLGPTDPVAVGALNRLKSCEARDEISDENVTTDDADGNGGNGGGGLGGSNITGDADGNNGGSGGAVGVSPVAMSILLGIVAMVPVVAVVSPATIFLSQAQSRSQTILVAIMAMGVAVVLHITMSQQPMLMRIIMAMVAVVAVVALMLPVISLLSFSLNEKN